MSPVSISRSCVLFSGSAARTLRGEEFVHRGERGGADVVFDAFGVGAGGRNGHAERLEESDDCLVAFLGAGGEGAAGGGEEDGAIRQRFDQALPLEALDGADDGHVGHAERTGDLRGPGFALLGDEVGDGFDVVLGPFLGMGAAGVALDGGGVAGAGGHGGGEWRFDTPGWAGVDMRA
jgi:hypothetical protein